MQRLSSAGGLWRPSLRIARAPTQERSTLSFVARQFAQKSYPNTKPLVLGDSEDAASSSSVFPVSAGKRDVVIRVRGFLSFTLIPAFILYQVFYADFGDSDHIFMPARRWLDHQKARFFTLSPTERAVARADQEFSPEVPTTAS